MRKLSEGSVQADALWMYGCGAGLRRPQPSSSPHPWAHAGCVSARARAGASNMCTALLRTPSCPTTGVHCCVAGPERVPACLFGVWRCLAACSVCSIPGPLARFFNRTHGTRVHGPPRHLFHVFGYRTDQGGHDIMEQNLRKLHAHNAFIPLHTPPHTAILSPLCLQRGPAGLQLCDPRVPRLRDGGLHQGGGPRREEGWRAHVCGQ